MTLALAPDDSLRDRCSPGSEVSPAAEAVQVWPLTQFFQFPFGMKIIDLPEGQIDDPSKGKYFSLPFLPAIRSFLSLTLEGLFELTQRLATLTRALHPGIIETCH